MKAYTGRLAFDPETEFHIGEDGEPVVTDDDGATWRYAEEADTSHNARYQTGVAAVDSTENQLARLAYEHGIEAANGMVDPHHFEVQPDDPHFSGVKSDPDDKAATITGHTEAYS